MGIRTVETLDDVDHGAAVVIRAHGVRPDVMERANARGLEVIDGTCTWVIQEQKELLRLVDEGYTIVLLGTPKHPEVVGLLGFAPDAIVVDEEEEWEAKVPRKKRMALISQSTQPPWKFEKLAAFMVGRSHELKIVNTVCPVTIRRQEDTVEAAQRGRSHGRRRRPFEREHEGAHAALRHRRDAGDPDRARGRPRRCSVFDGKKVVGVTGGTSTPIEDLRDVAERVLEIAGTPKVAARAAELAHEALAGAATPAGRTSSLPKFVHAEGATQTHGAA